jgi:hypothetical protein
VCAAWRRFPALTLICWKPPHGYTTSVTPPTLPPRACTPSTVPAICATPSFVEIAFAVGGTATHHSLVGRREMQPGEVLLLSERLMNRDAGGCVDASGWSWRVVLRKWQTRAP